MAVALQVQGSVQGTVWWWSGMMPIEKTNLAPTPKKVVYLKSKQNLSIKC